MRKASVLASKAVVVQEAEYVRDRTLHDRYNIDAVPALVIADSLGVVRYGHLGPINMGAGWAKKTPSMWPEPKRTFRPHRWSYAQAKGALDAAGRLINTELAERRNLILQNPGESYATSRTIVAAYQMIMPGEKARSHRHTPNALRLIIDSEPGAYTIVNGEKLKMMPGEGAVMNTSAGFDFAAAAFKCAMSRSSALRSLYFSGPTQPGNGESEKLRRRFAKSGCASRSRPRSSVPSRFSREGGAGLGEVAK